MTQTGAGILESWEARSSGFSHRNAQGIPGVRGIPEIFPGGENGGIQTCFIGRPEVWMSLVNDVGNAWFGLKWNGIRLEIGLGLRD